MSGPADRFEQDTDAVSAVRRAELGKFLHEYTGVLAETDQRVRLFTLAPEFTHIDAAVDAFSQVCDTWYNASANANILTILERGTEPRPWFAVSQHDSDTLATLQPELTPNSIETIISETADALRTLGLYNTFHGYLSPDDIYLPDATNNIDDLTVEIGGFGLEAAIRAVTGEFEPTGYTAPELLDNPDQPTEQTDVYGVGAITYFALTGSPPVKGDDLDQAIQNGPSIPPSGFNDAVPGELDDVVMHALSTNPDDRYDSPYAFGRAFLSTFALDELGPDNTGEDGHEKAETADSTESDANDSADSADTDETNVTRRAAVGLLGVGMLGGAGWYVSRGQLTAADPADQTTTPSPQTPQTTTQGTQADQSKTSDPPAEPSASISVTPEEPYVNDDVTFSAAQSTTGEGASLETYEWAVGVDTGFSVGSETLTQAFGESGEKTVRLRIADSQGRTATAVTTVIIEGVADGAPMFRYDAANTGATSDETGPQTSVTERWSYQTEGDVKSSPAVVDGTVYIGSNDGNVYALSADDGTEQWAFETGGGVESSPAVVDDTVYVGGGSNVYALSADDGTEQWAFETGGSVDSSPAVMYATVYVGSSDGYLYAVDAAAGEEEWRFETGDSFEDRNGVTSSPAVADGIVYVGSYADRLHAIDVATGEEEWFFVTDDSVVSSPAVVDGTVYVGDRNYGGAYGTLYAVDAATGDENWSFNTFSSIRSSPAVADGRIYVGNGAIDGENSGLYAVDAATGDSEWTFQPENNVDSSPAVVDGTVYVGSGDGYLYAVDAATGDKQWDFETGNWIESSPAVVDGTVYVGDDSGYVYALSGQ